MEVSNIIGTYTDHNEGLKTIHKPVFNLDDIFKLKNLYWRYGASQARFWAYKEKLTKRFSNDIVHLIGDKVGLNWNE